MPTAPADGAAFGAVIASSGDGATIAVGEVGAVFDGEAPIGEVFVFQKNGTMFGTAIQPMPLHGAHGDKFGASVALDATGETLAVGACGQASGDDDETDRSMPHAGAVYVFRHVNRGYGQDAFLKSDHPHASDNLCSVAIAGDGNTIVAAAVAENDSAGAVYVYTTDGVSWAQRARLVAPDAQPSDRFGAGLALSSDGATLIAGLPGRNRALIYDRSGDAWTLRTTLNGEPGFGEVVAISGLATTMVVGAKSSATIYPGEGRLAGVGTAVAVSRDGLVVAAAGAGLPGQLVHADGSPIDAPAFTGSVALSSDGSTLATGAIGDHDGTGEAYVHY